MTKLELTLKLMNMTKFELALELMKADAKSAKRRMTGTWSIGGGAMTVEELETPKEYQDPTDCTPYMPAPCALHAPLDIAYNPGMRF